MATLDDILAPKKAVTPVVVRPVQAIPVTQPVHPVVAPVAPPVVPVQPTPAAAPRVQPKQVSPSSYSDMYKMLNTNPKLDPGDEEREKKREKSRAVISAIGDGVSALSNLYFTTKGAPNMGASNLSERNTARREDMLKRRQAKQDAYNQGLMNAYDVDNKNDYNQRAYDYKVGRDAVADQNIANKQEAYNSKTIMDQFLKQQQINNTTSKNKTDESYKNALLGIKADENKRGWESLATRKKDNADKAEKMNKAKDIITVYDGDGKSLTVDRKTLSPESISQYLQNAVKKDGRPFSPDGLKDSPTARKIARDIGKYMKQSKDEDNNQTQSETTKKTIPGFGSHSVEKKKIPGF